MVPVRHRLALASLAVVVVAASAGLWASEDSRQLVGRWRDRNVRIDGNDEEWRDLTQPVKGHHFSVGFLNDAEALYFCLVSKDATTLRQIARVGLIVWLDPAGGKKKAFGVRFPVDYGWDARRRPERPRGEQDETPEGQGTGPGEAGQRDLQVLGPGKKDVRDLENGSAGIVGRFGVRGDLLVYELKIPLRRSAQVPFAPDVDPGAALRVGLQTPEWRGPLPLRRGGPMIGVGIGRPGGGVYYPNADMAVLKPIDIAADLRLATAPGQ